jgi:hypothetical protein
LEIEDNKTEMGGANSDDAITPQALSTFLTWVLSLIFIWEAHSTAVGWGTEMQAGR